MDLLLTLLLRCCWCWLLRLMLAANHAAKLPANQHTVYCERHSSTLVVL